MKKKLVLLLLVIFYAASVMAQSDSTVFKVVSFRKLDWDLDARSNYPMIDQNGHKAALIKVVIPENNFDFDVGVMGIVGVKQEIGETWVYVPEGVRKMTIRHKNYGIIRDYKFNIPIESATVYELTLEAHRPLQSKVVVRDSIIYLPSPVVKTEPAKKKPLGGSAIVTMGVPDISVGLMLLWQPGKTGGYLKYRSNFTASDHAYTCHNDGTTEGGYIWTDGESRTSRMNLTAGALLRLNSWLSACAGAGYGRRTLIWEDVDNNWARVEECSFSGFSADLGALFKFGRFTFYTGISTVSFRYFDAEIGAGFSF